jgi:CRISPR-associated endonuclease/helicase Cas3
VNQILLNAVYSRLAPLGQAMGRYRLSTHQVQTRQFLSDPNIEVVFNTALTGDGKSLSAYLPALCANRPTIGLYPTNELGRDQDRQVKHYVTDLSLVPHPQRVCHLTSEVLTEYATANDVSRQNALMTRIKKSEIIITNPDIYHLVMNLYYLRPYDARDKVFNALTMSFDLTVFDEFHIFSAPQIVSAVNSLLLMRATTSHGRKKFLFLSATPSPQLKEMLDRVGINYAVVEGEYRHAREEETGGINQTEYRRITHQVELLFDVVSRPDHTAEQWVIEQAEDVIAGFFHKHPDSRCAVILNSVGAVKRAVPRLKETLGRHGLKVGENTGFSTKSERLESLECDVLVGTSTIDVGVDFKINLLIFEATDAGNFIQRLGRLGRHNGYEDAQGRSVRFESFRAYALVPNFIHERLFEKPDEQTSAMKLTAGEHYDRPVFFDVLRDVYPPVNEFRHYAQEWGGLQSAFVFNSLESKEIRAPYEEIREHLRNDYERAFGINLNGKLNELRKYREGGEFSKETEILDTARSFRGGSGLECAVIDGTVRDKREQFKMYDLPGLLTNCVIAEILSEDEFNARAVAVGVEPAKFRYAEFYLVIRNYRDKPTRWNFHLEIDLDNLAIDRVRALKGLTVVKTDSEWENEINRRLRQKKLVCYIVESDNFDAKRRFRLPQLFPLYSLTDRYTVNDRQSSFSISFGQEALMIQSLLKQYRGKSKGWFV